MGTGRVPYGHSLAGDTPGTSGNAGFLGAGTSAGTSKIKKAFWEPPKKPFWKIVRLEEDTFHKAGGVPRV